MASLHKKKEYFRPFSSEERENKSHNLRVKDIVLSSGKKGNGLVYVPALAFCSQRFQQLPILFFQELPNELFPTFILTYKMPPFQFSTILKDASIFHSI